MVRTHGSFPEEASWKKHGIYLDSLDDFGMMEKSEIK